MFLDRLPLDRWMVHKGDGLVIKRRLPPGERSGERTMLRHASAEAPLGAGFGPR